MIAVACNPAANPKARKCTAVSEIAPQRIEPPLGYATTSPRVALAAPLAVLLSVKNGDYLRM